MSTSNPWWATELVDWSRPEPRKVRDLLKSAYPSAEAIVALAGKAGGGSHGECEGVGRNTRLARHPGGHCIGGQRSPLEHEHAAGCVFRVADPAEQLAFHARFPIVRGRCLT